MKKKFLVLLLASAMVTASLAGCSSDNRDNSSGGSASDETGESTTGETADTTENTASEVKLKDYKIAMPLSDSSLTSLTILAKNVKHLGELTNGTFVHQAIDLTADGAIAFVESQIAAGADGLIVVPPADSVLPTVTQLCEEAGVYWGIVYRSIADDDIRAIVEASPYYAGNCYENEEQAGYDVMKYLGEKGLKKIAIVSTT